jgi:hypothetical protein
MLEAIHERLGIALSDPEVELLEETTRPGSLVQQIEQIIEKRKSASTRRTGRSDVVAKKSAKADGQN